MVLMIRAGNMMIRVTWKTGGKTKLKVNWELQFHQITTLFFSDKFLEKAQCIIWQYGNYTAKSVNKTLNGVNTQV